MKSLVQAVLENSIRFPDKAAIIFDGLTVTYRELAANIESFAGSLKNRKISKGSRVVIEADDLVCYFSAFLGCQLYGCIAVPIEKDISIYHLQDILKTTKPKLVFYKDSGEHFQEYFPLDAPQGSFPAPKSDTECAIISTTGTTGKAVLVSHCNRSMLAAAQNLAEGTDIDEDTVLFCNGPFNLSSGYRRVMAVLYKGGTGVITNQTVSLAMLTEAIGQYHINHLSMTSSLLRMITDENVSDDLLNGVKYVESAAGPLSAHVLKRFHKLFPDAVLYNVYGTTESGCILINNTSSNYSEDCLGRPACHASVCLVDENRQEIREAGKYGYIAVRGDMNMLGYYRKKSLTEQVVDNNRIILNDIAYCDEEGYFYFVSRVGDIINVNGHKVIPSDIEKVALHFPGVLDCACGSKEDVNFGQVPVLYITCEDASQFAYEGLKKYLQEQLETYKVPKEILSLDKIPRTSTGKLMRKSLSVI